MNKEEYEKASTFDKLDYDIAMKIYFEHNAKIASINDHLGDIFDYSDLRDAEECELKDELARYRGALKEECDIIDMLTEYICDDNGTFDGSDKCKNIMLKMLKGEE